MKKDWLEVVLGVFLFVAANIFAFIYYYNRFYTILLLGLFFILDGVCALAYKKRLFDNKFFIYVYLAFLIFGLFGDLFLGVLLTKLWIYPSYSFLNYINLYLLIYPLGGLVMIYSFFLLEKFVSIKPRVNRVTEKHAIRSSFIIMIISFLIFIISVFFVQEYKGFMIFTTVAFFSYGLIDYLTLKMKRDNLFERFLIKPIQYALLIMAVAYTQGFLHEFPNVFVKEWVYQNFPLNEVTFFGIPIVVLFFGWLALVITPYAVFEYVLALNRNR